MNDFNEKRIELDCLKYADTFALEADMGFRPSTSQREWLSKFAE